MPWVLGFGMPRVWHCFCLNAGGSGIGNAKGSGIVLPVAILNAKGSGIGNAKGSGIGSV